MRRAIILGAIIISAYFSGFSQEPDDEVITAAKEFANALVESDEAAAERILSPDYGDVSLGFPTTRVILLSTLKQRPVGVARAVATDPDNNLTVVRVSDNTAVLTTKVNLKWKGSVNEAKKLRSCGRSLTQIRLPWSRSNRTASGELYRAT